MTVRRKHVFGVIMGIIFSFQAFGQSGWPMYLDDKTGWCFATISVSERLSNQDWWNRTYYSYYTSGDTIIGSDHYYNIYCSLGIFESNMGLGSGPPIDCGPIGAMRIDEGQFIFFKYNRTFEDYCNYCQTQLENIPSGQTLLLMDLNMAIGDTLIIPALYDNDFWYILNSINEIEIDDIIYEEYEYYVYAQIYTGELYYIYNKKWVAGFGDLEHGPLTGYLYSTDHYENEYYSYWSGGDTKWGDPSKCNCADQMHTSGHYEPTIFPNPNTGNFAIESNEWLKDLYILNTQGEVVFQVINAGFQIAVNIILPAGIYIVKGHTDQYTFNTKIVVQN